MRTKQWVPVSEKEYYNMGAIERFIFWIEIPLGEVKNYWSLPKVQDDIARIKESIFAMDFHDCKNEVDDGCAGCAHYAQEQEVVKARVDNLINEPLTMAELNA